ncbi:hypothetical protein SAMN02745781_03133 [Vibrio gazogenes DSM 21264]|uniref:Uncharacterized protein n=1 Tax=Vibrio gazogenes DSM 21264 = NBRC 103151 TaxID=1123492 RepID=A0A1M5EBX4_VIBGA|nr:hypothetical protein SAMN02745781_03133 [Vibrio gazogenes DSM 21264] [Vibrio gazogenes DSM 21264 = NBRC 103151]SJN53805.1 hypothetical protein BQ6471_00650 [Vibrio gazogenes]
MHKKSFKNKYLIFIYIQKIPFIASIYIILLTSSPPLHVQLGYEKGEKFNVS